MYLSCLVVENREVLPGSCYEYMYRKPYQGHAKATTERVKDNSNVEERCCVYVYVDLIWFDCRLSCSFPSLAPVLPWEGRHLQAPSLEVDGLTGS